jgi:TPR repeat protein
MIGSAKIISRLQSGPLAQVKAREAVHPTSRWALLLCLSLTLVIGSRRSAAVAQTTNAAPRFPSLAEVITKWKGKPVAAIEQAAEQGDLTAAHYLGYAYSWGEVLPHDAAKAVAWYERAGNAGYLPSLNNLALLYEQGGFLPQDLEKAAQLFRRAADVGFAGSQVNLGLLYLRSAGVWHDPIQAMHWFNRAAAQGAPEAMFQLYVAYHKGGGLQQDDAEARRWLVQGAEHGHPQAQCELGYVSEYPFDWAPYSPTRPISNDIPAAVRWYSASAAQGWAGGQYYLALCYLRGRGVEQDEPKALELMRKASDQNHAYALVKLAELYARGIGEPRNDQDRPIELLSRATQWIARDAGGPVLANALRFRYEHGLGTDRDLIEAARWYCRASAVDSRSYPIKDKILSPDKVWQADSFAQALSLYLRAITKQEGSATAAIATMYSEGRDVPQSPERAWAWTKLALDHGTADPHPKLAELETGLTPDQLKQARSRADDLGRESNYEPPK